MNALAATIKELARSRGIAAVVHPAAPGEALVEMDRTGARLIAEPAEFNERQMPAIVWLWGFPSMHRVRLVGAAPEAQWEIESTDGVPFHKTLSAQSFDELLKDLTIGAA